MRDGSDAGRGAGAGGAWAERLRPMLGLIVGLGVVTIGQLLAAHYLMGMAAEEMFGLSKFLSGAAAAAIALGLAVSLLGPHVSFWAKLVLLIAASIGAMAGGVVSSANAMVLSAHEQTLLLGLVLPYGALTALVLGWTLSGSLGRRVREIRASAAALAEGDLSARARLAGNDELTDLARSLNAVGESLTDAFRRRQELDNARRELIAAVSHDLRTPLASIRACSEALLDRVVTDQVTVDRYLHHIQADVEHLNALIEDLFELSQLESGALHLHRQPTSLARLVDEAVRSILPQAEGKRLAIDTAAIDPTIAPVEIDAQRVQRVLLNIVQNAIRHTPPDGSIWVAAADEGDSVRVTVTDSGHGVDAADVPRIFERFYRGDRARSRDQAGAGLGLAIARALIEAHGGRIWVEPVEGRYRRFAFTLPRAG